MSAEAIAPVSTPAPLAVAKPPRAPLAFIPSNLDDAWRIAEMLSKSGILPDALKARPHDILVTIMTGTELGLSPMAAIRDIYVVKGKGYMSALLKIALVKQSPECEYFRCIESNDKHAVFETKRRGEGVTRFEYTIEDAIRSELVGKSKKPDAQKDNWEKNPKLMMRRRCGSELADEVYSDIVRGIGNRDDVQQDEAAVNSAPTTFAPPPPQHEEAQLMEEKPAANVAAEKAFEKAKNDEVKPSTPQTETQMVAALKESIATTPPRAREPGDDDADENPIPPASPPLPANLHLERPLSTTLPGEDLAIFAALNMAKTVAELDLVAPRAAKIQGPARDELRKLYKMRKEEILRGQK